MSLTEEERNSLTRQLFDAIASVGFLTWKRDYPEDAKALVATLGADEVRAQYFRDFEKTAWAEIKEMVRNTTDERLDDAVADWMDRVEAVVLLDRAQEANASMVALRPVTVSLLESLMLDRYPSHPAVLTDFGICGQEHYEALYYPVRAGEITPQQLEGALGSGPKLSALVNAAPSNPHTAIEFKTAWDDLVPPRPSPAPQPSRPSLGKGRDFDMDK